MNVLKNSDCTGKVHNSIYQQIQQHGMATPVQVLTDVGVLSAGDLDNWRLGRVDYPERICKVNLHKLAFIMKQVRLCAKKQVLKPSRTCYKQWGRRNRK